MAFQITITTEAQTHWQALTSREQSRLAASIESRLVHQPATLTRAVRRLRPNPLAEFELRVGNLRVLYNVEGTQVVLLVVGRKVGNKLIVKREEFHGHQNDPAQPA